MGGRANSYEGYVATSAAEISLEVEQPIPARTKAVFWAEFREVAGDAAVNIRSTFDDHHRSNGPRRDLRLEDYAEDVGVEGNQILDGFIRELFTLAKGKLLEMVEAIARQHGVLPSPDRK